MPSGSLTPSRLAQRRARCTGSTPASSELPAELFRASTHHFGLAEAVELARAVGQLPERLVVFGIEGASFGRGRGPRAPAVADAVERRRRLPFARRWTACMSTR